MKRGSITPFCAMSLLLIASLLFALLEVARIYGLDSYATMKAQTVMDSVCAEYQPFLWKQYGLLFLDGAYGTEYFSMDYVTDSLESHMAANCSSGGWLQEKMGTNLFQIEPGKVQLLGYALAADDEGETFLNYIAAREKENMPFQIVEDLYHQFQKRQELEKEYSGVEASILEAKDVLQKVEEQWVLKQDVEDKENENAESITDEKPDTTVLKNAFNHAMTMQNSGTLNMIFEDLSGISTKDSMVSPGLQSREKSEGTMRFSGEKDWYRKVLVLNYMEEFFSNYTNVKEDHFLSYEMEYVISGKEKEWENLDNALDHIMLIREAANVAYILKDKEKMAVVESLASLVGLMAGENPGVVKVIEIGIVGAWAYMESVLDVRQLVAGGRIPLIKQEKEWTTSVTNLFAVFDKGVKAKSCENGLVYADYLKHILYTIKDSKLAYRMMEVMEIGLRQMEGFENCRMDQMVVALRCELGFQSNPLFETFVFVGERYDKAYYFSKEVERSYIP